MRRVRTFLKTAYELTRDTLDEFSKDRGELAAAALAFFTLLSLAPLIIIAVAIAGLLLGHAAAKRETTRVLTETMGPGSAEVVNEWVDQASSGVGVASVIGAALMLIAASRLTHYLKIALNQVWNVDVEEEEGFRATVKAYVQRRAFAFLLVLAAGPLLLVVFISRALVSGLHRVLFDNSVLEGYAVGITQFAFSLGLVAVVATLVFKFVPDTRVGWKVAAIGGTVTSLFFNLGNALIGLYLGQADVGKAYGLAGSLVVVLLWLHYSALMFLLGAEFTQVWAQRFGRSLQPDEEKAQQQVESEAARSRDKVGDTHAAHSVN